MRQQRPFLVLLLTVCGLLVGCTAGDDTASDDTPESGGAAPAEVPTGPAPGVTDDALKVGVVYVDLEAIGDIATLDHGDYEAAYQAMIDHVNEEGGINGRTLEATIVGVNPVGTEPAEAACTELTEDEQVFAVTGFFTTESLPCYLETHPTAVLGGSMTPELLDRAQAPWFTAASGSDMEVEVIRAMAEAGELDGTVGVFGSAAEEAQINDVVLPLLEELGIEVTDTGITDTGQNTDINASNAAVQVVAERFRSEGIDQVLIAGQAGLGWASGVESTGYRPELRLTRPDSIAAFANDPASHDLSILDGAVAGNPYGPSENTWNLPAMQECIPIVEAAGVPVPEPDSVPDDSGDVFLAGMEACRDITLLQALVEAGGEDLNYGSLVAGVDGLEVQLPDQPDPVTYGPPPSADGDIPAYLYDWDPDTVQFQLRAG